MKKSFILHLDSLSVLDELSTEQKGQLFEAIYKYHLGEEVTLDFAMKMAFLPFKNQFARDNEAYERVVERNKKNGQKGGRPQEPKKPTGLSGNPQEPKKPYNDSDSVNESENENKKVSKKEEKEKKEISTPSTSENQVPDFIIQEQKKITPHVAAAPPLSLEEIEDKMRNSQLLSESVRKSNSIGQSEYQEAMEEFFLEKRAEGKIPKNESDHKKHFMSWVRIWASVRAKNHNQPKKGKIESMFSNMREVLSELNEANNEQYPIINQ